MNNIKYSRFSEREWGNPDQKETHCVIVAYLEQSPRAVQSIHYISHLVTIIYIPYIIPGGNSYVAFSWIASYALENLHRVLYIHSATMKLHSNWEMKKVKTQHSTIITSFITHRNVNPFFLVYRYVQSIAVDELNPTVPNKTHFGWVHSEIYRLEFRERRLARSAIASAQSQILRSWILRRYISL